MAEARHRDLKTHRRVKLVLGVICTVMFVVAGVEKVVATLVAALFLEPNPSHAAPTTIAVVGPAAN